VALAAVLAVVHGGHEDTGAALYDVSWVQNSQRIKVTYAFLGALAAEALDLAVTVNLVILEHSQLGPVALLTSCFSRDEIRGTHFLRLCLIFLGVV
jgi:hypothetical protein